MKHRPSLRLNLVQHALCVLVLVLGFSQATFAAEDIFPAEGIELSKTIMLDAQAQISQLQREGLNNSRAQSSLLIQAYNRLVKEELKKQTPDHNKINRWYMNQASQILNLDAESTKFFKQNLSAVNPSNPFFYRSKDGKNYMAFPPLKSGNIEHGSLVSVEEHFNAHVRDVSVLQNVKNSANPQHVQFFPREYLRFMSVSFAVTWEMCQVEWFSGKSVLSFESLYRTKTLGEKKDPLCEEHFIKSLQDPIGWLGFYGFIMTNHALAPRLSNFAFQKLGAALSNSKMPFLQKQIAFYKFVTNIAANGLGMAAGLTVSDYIHQLKENQNLKACFKDVSASGWFGGYCTEAYKDFLLINSAAQDRMIISAGSLLSAFAMNTVAQIPLQGAVHAARVGAFAAKQAITHGVRAGMHVALGLIPLGPAGWVAGTVIYVGSTYLFLRFDHMISPYIESWWYNYSKPRAIRHSLDNMIDIVHRQEQIKWANPISEREEGELCLKERISNFYDYLVENNYVKRVFEGKAKCDNPILLDQALTEFSLAMSEHRNLNILSGVSSTISIWQNKWSGFYYNYMASMKMLDQLAQYRREHRERLGPVDMNQKYGFDPTKRSSVEVFDELFNPLYGFEAEILNAKDAVYGKHGMGVDHVQLVNNVHEWIRGSITTADKRFGNRPTITWKTHLKPAMEKLLDIQDPLLLAEGLIKLRHMSEGAGHYATKPVISVLKRVFTPVFPFMSDYLGAATAHRVPINKHFMELEPSQQEELLVLRQNEKCKGSLEGEGVCSLTPEEILDLVDSYIPMIDSVSVDLGYDISSGDRSNIDGVIASAGYEFPNTFDPNCTTFSLFGSDNPTCWFSKGLKDANGNPYNARFKTPQFSDQILAHMSCGISNRPYLSTTDGPKNFVGSGSLYKSENFSAVFTPPNLLKGAPACESISYNFGGRELTPGDTMDLHRSLIRVNNKTYYGALGLVTDPSNPWIINDDINSLETYWNTYVFPTAKEIAQNLYRHYQKVIIDKLLPLFKQDDYYLDYNNLMKGKDQINLFANLDRMDNAYDYMVNWVPTGSYGDMQYTPVSHYVQFTSKNLRESFIQQARLYLQLVQKVSDLSDDKAENILSTLNFYITTMQRTAVDYTLEGDAFIQEMKVKKAYHDNIMQKRSEHLTNLINETFDGIGSPIDWINREDRARFMSQVKVADALTKVDDLVAIRIVDYFVTLKNDTDRNPDPADLFGTNNYHLKNALLFEPKDMDALEQYLRPLFYKLDNDEITPDALFEQLLSDNESGVITLAEASTSDLFKDWLVQRLRGDLLGLTGELKAQYLDDWIHGNKFYLNNLQLEQ